MGCSRSIKQTMSSHCGHVFTTDASEMCQVIKENVDCICFCCCMLYYSLCNYFLLSIFSNVYHSKNYCIMHVLHYVHNNVMHVRACVVCVCCAFVCACVCVVHVDVCAVCVCVVCVLCVHSCVHVSCVYVYVCICVCVCHVCVATLSGQKSISIYIMCQQVVCILIPKCCSIQYDY